MNVEWFESRYYVHNMEKAKKMLRDPEDAPLVALALLLEVPIVSGDKDLISLKKVKVFKPAEVVKGLLK